MMKRSLFFQKIAAGAAGVTFMQKQVFGEFRETENLSGLFYTGCYTDSPSEGIALCSFDTVSGAVQVTDTCKAVANASFLIFGINRKIVYAVNETANFGGKNSGSVSSFRCDETTGKLTFLNSQPSLGAHPCHLFADRSGKYILVANYTGGNVAVLPVLADGSLDEPVDQVQHSGRGFNAARQEGPHAHSVNLSPDNRFAFVCDLGLDKIMIYRFDQEKGKLSPADNPFFQTARGAGPRHFKFSPDGAYAFVVNELNSTVTCLKYDPSTGGLTELQTLTTLPEGFAGGNTCADIHVHPNGRFVYASNRGNDSIAVYGAGGDGRLKLLQHQPTMGKTPRNFAIHPTGKFLVAANQNSNSLTVFFLDPVTGKLSSTGKSARINKPVCLLF